MMHLKMVTMIIITMLIMIITTVVSMDDVDVDEKTSDPPPIHHPCHGEYALLGSALIPPFPYS